MRVLVTGAAGFVGKHVLDELTRTGHTPIALDHRAHARGAQPDIVWRQCDLLDRAAIAGVLAETRPEGCIHLAGLTFVPEGAANPDPMLRINVMGTLHLLDALRASRSGCRVLCVSTAHVYGETETAEALDENAPLRPVTVYAISKAAADLAALGYAETWGLPVMTARPNNHTGPGQSERFVVPGLLAQAAAIAAGKTEAVIRAGNLDSERDFTDVRDVARAYRLLLESGRPGLAYNIGSGTCSPIRTLLDRICGLLDIHPRIETDPEKFRPRDRSPLLDTSRIRNHTDWAPEIGLDCTLHDMLAQHHPRLATREPSA